VFSGLESKLQMTRQRYFFLFLALLAIALSWWGIFTGRAGLVVRSLEREGVPLLYMAPQAPVEKVPGVLVAHGFAGSKQLMQGYGQVLAQAGYAVMLWDFSGHGANGTPLGEWSSLQGDLEVARAGLLEQPEVDATRLALLGHSMGGGAVMSAAIEDVEQFAATVAISATTAAVTPTAPRNLMLQIGAWEGRLLPYTKELLAKAGGESDRLAQGRGRSLVVVPNAEHITILFRDRSHQAAKSWLNGTFNLSPSSKYADRRLVWYALHLMAWLATGVIVAPVLIKSEGAGDRLNGFRRWGGLIISPLLGSGVLALITGVVELPNLGGLLVGSTVGVWFLIAGSIWLAILWKLPRPTLRGVGLGVLLFALLWVAFGLMGQVVWLQWLLIPQRLQLWLVLSAMCFPWFLAAGVAQPQQRFGSRLGWWFMESLALVVGLVLALFWVPGLGFVFLLLPVFPVLMGILSVAAAFLGEAWGYGVGSALFFGWILAAVFPLVGSGF
jgi:pimeloyl-ACP methyl ester carboxylesterase